MTWKPFLALPNYFGGKRRLAPTIFKEIAGIYPARTWPDLTLLDPFAGACSLALYAKAQGMRVICGDAAERSYIIQRAFIANDTETLTEEDQSLVFQKRNAYNHFACNALVPNHFPAAFADFLDLAMANLADHSSLTRQALLKVVVYKAMLGPVIHHGITCLSRAADSDNLESLTWHNAKRIEPWWLTPPPLIVRRLARAINKAVFANGYDNLVHQTDALNLVSEFADQADILYLDPPYPEVTGYETYWVIDSVLAGKLIRQDISPWSSASQFTAHLHQLLEQAETVPLWLISYGNVGTTLAYLLEVVRSHRPGARAVTVAFPHLQALARTDVSDANKEFLIIGAK